jgi:dienelactone hydrolase
MQPVRISAVAGVLLGAALAAAAAPPRVITTTAYMDYGGATAESNAFPLALLGTAGARLAPETDAALAAPGTVATYALTLRNTGSDPDSYRLSATGGWAAEILADADNDGRLDPGDARALNAIEDLAPGASRSFLVAVHVPVSAARGATQRTGILAVSTADPFQSARGTLTTTVREPRLRLLPPTSRRAGAPGATAYHSIALENSGDSAERFIISLASEQGWPAQVLIDENKDGSHQENETRLVEQIDLAAGGVFHAFVAVTLPADARGIDRLRVACRAVTGGDEASATVTTAAGRVVTVDPTADVHPISPLIYGLTDDGTGSAATYRQLRTPLIAGVMPPDGSPTAAGSPGGPAPRGAGSGARAFGVGASGRDVPSSADAFVARNRALGAATMFASPAPGDEWLRHFLQRFGAAAQGGVRAYRVGADITSGSPARTPDADRPPILSYDQAYDRFVAAAQSVKGLDPSALVVGPSSDAWSLGLFAGVDPGERAAHGDMPFLPWFLQRLQGETGSAGRLLDLLDVRYQPAAPGLLEDRTDPATNALRLRATRSLWDPSYTDESPLQQPVQLLPRLRVWLQQYAPEAKIALTGWSWGADRTVNGALAIAETLGILGREGAGLALYGATPRAGSPAFRVFRLLRSYDGRGAGFGDLSCRAEGSDDAVSVYASRDSASGALKVLLINKDPAAAQEVQIALRHFQPAAKGKRVQLAGSDFHFGTGTLSVNPDGVAPVLPPSSVTLLVLPSDSGTPAPPGAPQAAPAGPAIRLTWGASEGATGYHLYRSERPAGPFRRLDTRPLAQPEMLDRRVAAGRPYWYRATALSRTGRESRPSTTLQVLRPRTS